MKTVEMDDANLSLAEYARKVGEEPFVVTDHGNRSQSFCRWRIRTLKRHH